MSDFIAGKLAPKTLFDDNSEISSLVPSEPIHFSPEAQAVMDAGREIWYYYMHHKDGEMYGAQSINVNASFYDIRRYFQGVDEKGRMNSESQDMTYKALLGVLREKLEILANNIEKKVYEHGFLRDASNIEFPDDLSEDSPKDNVPPETKPAKVAKPKIKKATKNPTIVNYGTVNIYEK